MENKENVMYDRFRKLLDNREKYDKKRKEEFSINKLRSLIRKHMTTLMIGNIAKIESFFGELWGHGLRESECTSDQLDKFDVWEQCRDEILTNGNKLINILLSELSKFDINYKGNVIYLNRKGEKND